MMYEFIIIVLLAVVCYLLYQIYRINYRVRNSPDSSLLESFKNDLKSLDDNKGRSLEMRFKDVNSRISELEKTIEKNNNFVQRLADELS